MNNIVLNIAHMLKDYRERAGLSQKNLARNAGVIQPFISNLENGKIDNITIETVEKIFSVIGYGVKIKPYKLPREEYKNHPVPYSVKCFWDVDRNNLSLLKNTRFIVERILEFGDKRDVKWLFSNLRTEKIIEILRKSRSLSKKSLNFWADYFGVNKRGALCLLKQLQKKQGKIWQY
ncbi:MAG: helix-turn-helix domain-containing protein [Elusimicrobia bacterium]|nr:helix-turn-helix domain-containing protein [Elusimicrobiota bacterium]